MRQVPASFDNFHVYVLATTAYLGIVLFGYDVGIGGGIVTQEAFKDNFGLTNASTSHVNAVSSNVVSVLQGGAFFGALGSAPLSSAIGRRFSLIAFTLVFCSGAILTTLAGPGNKGLNQIYIGRVISGLGVGGISAIAPTYVSECAPKNVRGRVTGLFQVFVSIGVMISYWTNYGVQKHIRAGPRIWRIPFGIQLIPGGLMAIGWLVIKGRDSEALRNLAFLRRRHPRDESIIDELSEIEASVLEERQARIGLDWREAFFGPGNSIRFAIAFVFFLLQQFSGQNSVGYYAPTIFQSIGYTEEGVSLLASGVYGVVKVVATALFVFFLLDYAGRKWSLFTSSFGMGALFYVIGVLLKVYPPDPNAEHPARASKVMAGLLYIYVVFYSGGWGPIPWVYCSDIFPNRTRHYGLGFASATQWLFNFVVSKVTPTMVTSLGWKIFITFATIDILGGCTLALLIPETKNKSLEEMDIVFGTVTKERRYVDVSRAQHDLLIGKIAAGVYDRTYELNGYYEGV